MFPWGVSVVQTNKIQIHRESVVHTRMIQKTVFLVARVCCEHIWVELFCVKTSLKNAADKLNTEVRFSWVVLDV